MLQEVTQGAGLDHALDEAPVGVHGQGNDSDLPVLFENLAGGVDAVEVRHGDVHDHHIGAEFPGQPHCAAAVAGFPDHLKAAFPLQQGRQPLPHDLVVIGQEDFNAHMSPPCS
jgi:hypothetical protein